MTLDVNSAFLSWEAVYRVQHLGGNLDFRNGFCKNDTMSLGNVSANRRRYYLYCTLMACWVCNNDVQPVPGMWPEPLDASGQIKTVVNKVVFPTIDLILAVFFFAKLGTAYFDYRKHGQFEWAAPAILFACLVFTPTAPAYGQFLGCREK